jgi:hypothetical protein
MKKVIKVILLVIASIILLGVIFGIVDNNRANSEKLPLFAVHVGKDKTTNADLYYGIGYVVVKCPPIPKNSEITVDDYIKFQILDSRHVCVVDGGTLDEE